MCGDCKYYGKLTNDVSLMLWFDNCDDLHKV